MYISPSLTILQCNDNVNNYEDGISGRPDKFTAVGYQTLAFIQVLEKQRLGKKKKWISVTRLKKQRMEWNNSKFTDLFTPASATASSLDSPTGNAPGKSNHWRLSYVWERNNVCSQPSQAQQFPSTHKKRNVTAVLWNSHVGKPPSLADSTENCPRLQAQNPPGSLSLQMHGAPPVRVFSSHFGFFPPIPTWLQAQPQGFHVQLFILEAARGAVCISPTGS